MIVLKIIKQSIYNFLDYQSNKKNLYSKRIPSKYFFTQYTIHLSDKCEKI